MGEMMPWTADDAKRHSADLTPEQQTAWAKIANAALADCRSKNGSDCEGYAVRVANAGAARVGKVAKVDPRGLVYGWANVVTKSDGTLVEDSQGDLIEPEDLENAMVDFMRDYRTTGEMHAGEATGVIVESVVITPAKLEAMGFAPDIAKSQPIGAWIGVQLDPQGETFRKVQEGIYKMFSIQGSGNRVPA